MTSPHYADRVASALRARSLSDLPVSAESRTASIAALEKALRDKTLSRSRRRRFAIIGSAAAIAATLALAFGLARHHAAANTVASTPTTPSTPAHDDAVTMVAHPSGGGASVVASSGADPTTLGEGSRIVRGSRVVAGPSGRALLALSTGTQLTVEESGDLTVLENGTEQRFRLGSGRVHADVAKLHEGDRFLVETSDTEVEVRGTSFDVAVVDPVSSCGDGVRTRVSVHEGVVVVRHDGRLDRVVAGEEWPRNCPTVKPTPPHTSAATSVSAVSAVSPVSPVNAANAANPSLAKTTLVAENALVQQGMDAKRAGDYATAATIFDRYLTTYPHGNPLLVESATKERMRALRKSGDTRARDAARKYLDAYPSGDARPEAEAFLALPR